MYSYNIPLFKKEKIREIGLKNNFTNIKSKYIVQIIFENLSKRKLLELIKYNNNIQKRLNINTNNYKEYNELYSETYSPIEIEIKPSTFCSGPFININNEEDMKYFHIYFNDNKEEIKRSIYNNKDKVTKIKIIIDYQITSFEKLFYMCAIEAIYFKRINRKNIYFMDFMFSRCSYLKELDISKIDTSNVKDMRGIFSHCPDLEELNITNFNTDKITDMSEMFYGCSKLKELNLSNFNTNNVTNMRFMFCGCYKLKELNVSNFNINNVTNMSLMLYGCPIELKKKMRAEFKNIKEEAFDLVN